MRKVLTALVAGGLLLTGVGATTAPAVAEEVPTTAETVVTAPIDAVVTADTVQVTTTAAPATVEPVDTTTDGTAVYNLVGVAQLEATAPTETVAPVAPVALAPAETTAPVAGSTADTVPATQDQLQLGDAWAGVGTYYNTPTSLGCQAGFYQFSGGECVDPSTAAVVPSAATVAPTADTYPAPLPTTPTCYEDGTTNVPGVSCVWDCATMGNGICGNPDCIAKNQFTVSPDGQCSAKPNGYEAFDLQAEGMALGVKLGQLYVLSGSNKDMQLDHCAYDIIPSETVPNAVHVFNKKPGTEGCKGK